MQDTAKPHRYIVLDSLRGICACMVALFHFRANSHLYDIEIIRNSYLFVDFFFVLSGFVIFANYENRIREGFGFVKFMLLRFGRLYPLHIAILLAFVGVEFVQIFVQGLQQHAQFEPFSSPSENLGTLISNVFLIHGIGIYDRVTWNGPSWSISTEFYTYALFAAAIIAFKNHIRWFLYAVLAICPVILFIVSPSFMSTDAEYGFIRCIFSFSAGALTWGIIKKYQDIQLFKGGYIQYWHIAELLTAVIVIMFVITAGRGVFTLLAPFVFSMTIFLFAFERGLISKILKYRFFVFLGTLSYSIYMSHAFIHVKIFFGLGPIAEKFLQDKVIVMVDGMKRIGSDQWHGDIATILYMVMVFTASFITYKLIEAPFRKIFRNIAYKKQSEKVVSIDQAA
ncbi:MAG: acyltransferase [Candidatus Thiodiazotropha sp. (ex Codakia orbicularis)]|nr:acyltransferase [Candidatus Thiodiazotropha sp. (ex Codakia orbicularis)]